jgi:hypothetical protein
LSYKLAFKFYSNFKNIKYFLKIKNLSKTNDKQIRIRCRFEWFCGEEVKDEA